MRQSIAAKSGAAKRLALHSRVLACAPKTTVASAYVDTKKGQQGKKKGNLRLAGRDETLSVQLQRTPTSTHYAKVGDGVNGSYVADPHDPTEYISYGNNTSTFAVRILMSIQLTGSVEESGSLLSSARQQRITV